MRAIVALAPKLGLQVVAEGVETVAQLRWVHDLQCDELQGFLFSKAVAASASLLRTAAPDAAARHRHAGEPVDCWDG